MRLQLKNKTEEVDKLMVDNKKLEEEKEQLQKIKAELENQAAPSKNPFHSLLSPNSNKQQKNEVDSVKQELEEHINHEKDQEEKYLKEIEEVTNKNKEWDKKLKEEEMKRETAEKEVEKLKKKLNIKSERIKPEQTQNSSSSDSQETLRDIDVEVDPDCNFIHLKNMSDQDKPLGGRQLKVQINNSEPITYTFDSSIELKDGEFVTIWCKGCGRHHPDTGELVWKDLKSWKSGDTVQATLQ